jgi:hypothetical protein
VGADLREYDLQPLCSLRLTPRQNTFSECLGPFGFNVFIALVVDLLHEFELGVWRMLLLHLLRIIFALNKDLIHELDKRSVDYLHDFSMG